MKKSIFVFIALNFCLPLFALEVKPQHSRQLAQANSAITNNLSPGFENRLGTNGLPTNPNPPSGPALPPAQPVLPPTGPVLPPPQPVLPPANPALPPSGPTPRLPSAPLAPPNIRPRISELAGLDQSGGPLIFSPLVTPGFGLLAQHRKFV